jgi:RimJ/RimL family protein N-acetyltransferase
MPGGTFLSGDRLDLCTVTRSDYGFLCEHGNRPAIRNGAPVPIPVSEQDIAAFVEDDSDSVQFLACRDGTPVGFVFLFDIESQRDHAEVGVWIVPDEQGNGYGTDTLRLCLDHAFDDRGLHKVLARVFEHNTASQQMVESLGFEQEGRLREHEYIRGEYRDTLLYGIVASEWTPEHRDS